jgi:hypothetical protein
MTVDLVQLRVLAQKKEEENWRFRQFLKTRCDLEPEEIDKRVFATTKRVWAGIDCTQCANCCREIKPTFSEEDVSRLAQRLGMAPPQFIGAYLDPTEPATKIPGKRALRPVRFWRTTVAVSMKIALPIAEATPTFTNLNSCSGPWA